ASAISGGVIPQPSSSTSMRAIPPSASRTEIRFAPASIAFSTSSLSAAAGLSTTSPAAIRFTSFSGRRRIDMEPLLAQSNANRDPPAQPDHFVQQAPRGRAGIFLLIGPVAAGHADAH